MNQELPGLIAEAHAIAGDARRIFGALNGEQLNWKRSADEWSVAQCFEHLIKINSTYFPQLQDVADGSHLQTWRARVPFLPRLFGSLVLGAVKPAAPRKLKAARHVQPATSAIGPDIIERFVTHQQDVIERMKQTGHRDLSAVVIISPLAPIAVYSVLDAFRIIVTHERRHMAQAERVTKAGGFPR